VSIDKELREIGAKTREAHRLEEEGKISEAVELLTSLSQEFRALAERAGTSSLRGVLMQRSREYADNATRLKRKYIEEKPTIEPGPKMKGMAEVQFLRDSAVKDRLLKILQSAQYRILIATHQIHAVEIPKQKSDKTPSDLIALLKERFDSGVKVRILTTPPSHLPGVTRWKQADALRTLASHGVEFHLCSRLHYNFVLSDDTAVWTGTAPLTEEGLGGLDDIVEFSTDHWLKAIYLDLFRARWERSDLTCENCYEKTCLAKFKSEDPRRNFEEKSQ
jgi:phosphatidylserine/phosphatidylglycerophosphate/cardiolipin synthase-like enzyme